MNAILIVTGFILLVAGHQSRWMFAGGIGLLAGSLLLPALGQAHSQVDWITSSMVCGALGALLANYFKRPVIGLAALASGMYVSTYLPQALGWETGWLNWSVAALVGIAAALAYWAWGDIVLIGLSTVTGSTLVVQYLKITTINVNFVFILFLLFGLAAQWVMWQYGHSET